MTTAELATELRVPQRRVLSWIEHGYLEASGAAPSGHGSRRAWTEEDRKKAHLIRDLESLLKVSVVKRITQLWR